MILAMLGSAAWWRGAQAERRARAELARVADLERQLMAGPRPVDDRAGLKPGATSPMAGGAGLKPGATPHVAGRAGPEPGATPRVAGGPEAGATRAQGVTSGRVAPTFRSAPAVAQLSGVSVKTEDDAILIGFSGGLFGPGSADLSRGARRRIAAVAEALATEPGPLTVHVTGHADARPVRRGRRWRDNWTLALTRATIVANQLRARGGNASALTVSASERPPFHDPQGGAASRTVVLTLRKQ